MQAELDYEAGEDEAAPDAELKGVQQDDARTTQLADELKVRGPFKAWPRFVSCIGAPVCGS